MVIQTKIEWLIYYFKMNSFMEIQTKITSQITSHSVCRYFYFRFLHKCQVHFALQVHVLEFLVEFMKLKI